MIDAGSKGGELNVQQISACVGTNVIKGARIADTDVSHHVPVPAARRVRADGGVSRTRTLAHEPRRRWLPHALQCYPDARGGGYVEHSFYDGLDAYEFFTHAAGAREGLMDTATNTADTGALQRRMVKFLEDLMVRYDGSVRRASQRIVQFTYGVDPALAERKSMPEAAWPRARVRADLYDASAAPVEWRPLRAALGALRVAQRPLTLARRLRRAT